MSLLVSKGPSRAELERATAQYQREIAGGASPREAWERTAAEHGAHAASLAKGDGLEDVFDREPKREKLTPPSTLGDPSSSTSMHAPRKGGRILL